MIALLPDLRSWSRESQDDVNQYCPSEGQYATIYKFTSPTLNLWSNNKTKKRLELGDKCAIGIKPKS